MTLDTSLKNVDWRGGEPIKNGQFITIDTEQNSITFKLQNGPIKEVGVNGCQVDQIIRSATDIIRHFNSVFPCRENSLAITKLEEALHWLDARTRNRVARDVEGTNQA